MKQKKPKQLYRKLFWTYTIIVICIVFALTGYFLSVSRKRTLESNMAETERISREAVDYLKETEGIANYLFNDLYRSETELEELLAYFYLEPEEYQKYRLNRYIGTNQLVHRGIYNFITEAFEGYEELEKIELIAYQDFSMTCCYPEKIFYPAKDGKARLYELQEKKKSEEGKLVYIKEVRNPDNMEAAGCIIFTFEGKKAFRRLLNDTVYTKLAVLSESEEVVFQNTDKEDWQKSLQEKYYFVRKESAEDYKVCAFLNKKEASALSAVTVLTIMGVGLLVAALGVGRIHFYIQRITRRVDSILDAMNQVTTGNLQVRLKMEHNRDELDMIAANFNEMCEKLELYIQKSYLAEIERKDAEMQALQSQINPHFLYNTLEAIRMKAICNGDREVGKMLYSMVVLFRSQIKEADVISLGQELDYCKQYLELFEYRYKGSFQSTVECEPELLSVPIIKFVLQPVIENYFIHGIERDRTDNELKIWAEQKEKKLYLYVQDNGCGMDACDMEKKNQELQRNLADREKKKSIGITNVNRRIKAVYGEEYGISIQAAVPKGLLVVVTIKAEERNAHEEGHVGGG